MFFQVLLNSIIAGSIYSLLAFGFTIVYGTLNFFNMAYGIAYTLGAYFCFVFRLKLGIPLIPSVALAIMTSTLIMSLVDRFTYRPLRQKNAPSWSLVVCSIGVALLMEALISIVFGTDIISMRVGEAKPGYPLLSATITPIQISIVVVSVITMILLLLFLWRTRTGRAMRATSDEPEMARIVGINIEKVFVETFALSSGLAALSGCLIVLETDLFPTMGHFALLKGIVASIIGGIGNVRGAMVGGLLLGFVENFGIWHISADWKDAIALVLLIIIIVSRPSFFGMSTVNK